MYFIIFYKAEITRLKVTWPIDPIYFILKSYIPQPYLFPSFGLILPPLKSFLHSRINLDTISTISISSFYNNSSIRLNEPAQAEILEHKLRKLIADQRLSRLVLVKQEDWTHALLRSHHEKLRVSGKRIASRARLAWLLGRQHQLQLMVNAKVKDLNVTLDNPADSADESWWMI